jgi:3-isopropylmalate/(R)-2-methylmalate dehydratase small subunit
MYNCGMIAAELPADTLEELFKTFAGTETVLLVNTEESTLTFKSGNKEQIVPFILRDFERALVEAGGWVEYAAVHY